jgi:hypothetical protein
MPYFRKKTFYLYHRMMKFSGAFPERLMGRKKFSMLVQDPLPIDTTIVKY